AAPAGLAATESEGAVCLACRGRTPAGALFCPGCGTSLRPPPPLPSFIGFHDEKDRVADVVHEGEREGERKTATVLHCGVPTAAALAEGLGGGGMLYLMRRLLEVAAEETCRYDGVVGERHGDGFVALFGARATHEDD